MGNKIIWFGHSEGGNYRKRNEDYFKYFKIDEGHYFLAIADGMGGHSRGDLASKLGIDFCFDFYRKNYFKDNLSPLEVLEKAIFYAHNQIKKMSNSSSKKTIVGTTLSAMIIKDSFASIAHVGDSRIYHIRGNKILQLTTDHSLVNTLLREKILRREEAANYPNKNVLTQSVGVKVKISPQKIKNIETKIGDIFFLTTDGLHDYFTSQELIAYFKKYSIKKATYKLITDAMDRKSKDNITILTAKVNE